MGALCTAIAAATETAMEAARPSLEVESSSITSEEEEILPRVHPQGIPPGSAHWVCGTCGAFLYTRRVISWRTCPVCGYKAGTQYSEDVQTWPVAATRSENARLPRTM